MDLNEEIIKTLNITDELWKQKRRLDELGTDPLNLAYDAILDRMRQAHQELEVIAYHIPDQQYIIGDDYNIQTLG